MTLTSVSSDLACVKELYLCRAVLFQLSNPTKFLRLRHIVLYSAGKY